ncbi:carbon-nitrogen hydrolase family protein [Streptomyces sp. NPDC057611]|uniref:carbon-nitrogen hydrolase family protein n=1 Tax=Streptomyces sp. NPDC057611 TaxID=3346182 RepID=UPI0036794CFE
MTVVALEQTAPSPGAVEDNTADLLRRAELALGSSDIVVFPELANTGYVTEPAEVARVAQPLDGRLVEDLRRVAGRHDGLVATGFAEREGGEFYNSVVIVGSDGPLLRYRKLHLFDAEQLAYAPGYDLPVVETEFGVLAACICYDLRFVEVLRLLSLKGAEIVLAPAAWVGGFDSDVPARGMVQQAEAVIVQANLDQVGVAAVSQGPRPDVTDVRPLGGSIAVDATGTVLAGPLSRTGADSATVTFDPAAVRAARVRSERIRPRQDRRTDLYAVTLRDERW